MMDTSQEKLAYKVVTLAIQRGFFFTSQWDILKLEFKVKFATERLEITASDPILYNAICTAGISALTNIIEESK